LAEGFLLHIMPLEFQFLELFVQQNFFKISKVILHFELQGSHFSIFFKTKKKSFRIPTKLHLMAEFFFQKMPFLKNLYFMEKIVKIFKLFEKIIFCWKTKWWCYTNLRGLVWSILDHRLRNKNSKFFYLSHFSIAQRVFQNWDNAAGHIRQNLKLKVANIHLAAGFLLNNMPLEFQFSASFSHNKARTKFMGRPVRSYAV